MTGPAGRLFAEVTFDWVVVGHPGNAPHPFYQLFVPGIGSVDYEYQIAKHEVTNDQYAEFLNAVAASDPHGLYNLGMGEDRRGGIMRVGMPGDYSYIVKVNMGNKPVNYVSFLDALRFVNWLHHGQPIGIQDAATTEDGVYAVSDGLSELRSADARFFIPTENEWYKAAYYQPTELGGDADGYWMYATASNELPEKAFTSSFGNIINDKPNVANYGLGVSWNGAFGNVSSVGSAGPLSDSFYGTADQSGNVKEWNETVSEDSFRIDHGGSWSGIATFMSSLSRGSSSPLFEGSTFGFRVAGPIPVLSADLDGDGDVDLFDYVIFEMELTGPLPIAIENAEIQSLGAALNPSDFDEDGDVDLSDFGILQCEFTGENQDVSGKGATGSLLPVYEVGLARAGKPPVAPDAGRSGVSQALSE